MARFALGPWFHKKVIDPLIQILRKDAELKQLAFSATLGITLGVFPICEVTVFLRGLAIALLGSRCHAPSVMLANFMATPIELSLLLPFLRFGEILTGGPLLLYLPLATKMFQFARLSLACPWIQQQFERLTYSGISGSTPNDSVDKSSWESSACYPRRTFNPLSESPSTQDSRITMADFRLCSTSRSQSQAGLYHYTHEQNLSLSLPSHTFVTL